MQRKREREREMKRDKEYIYSSKTVKYMGNQ